MLKTHSLRILVQALAAGGELDAANEAIKAFKESEADKALSLVAIARAQARAGDRAAAKETLDRAFVAAGGIHRQPNTINDDPARREDEALSEIAAAQAEIGAFDDALATAASHGDDRWKAQVLAKIAPAQARAGDLAGAIKTTETIRDEGQMAEAFLRIAHDQSQAGHEKEALAWAAELTAPQTRALALLGIVEGQIDARNSKPAK